MQPSAWRRAPPRHGHRSVTCRGVSASSSHTRHRAAGHPMLAQPGQVVVGRRPMRWRYWADWLQWPARSWCVSTAVSRLSPRTGPGSLCWPKISLYHPSGQASCHAWRAALAAARVALLVSMGASDWSRLAASFAISSARSLPATPQCAGTHCRWTGRPRSASRRSSRQTSAPRCVDWAAGPLSSVASAAWESRQAMIGLSSVGPASSFSATLERASRRAIISALVLEQ